MMKTISKIPIAKFVIDEVNDLHVFVIKAKLNKHEFNFILDTGSTITQIDKLNSINANTSGNVKGITAGGEINIQHESFNLSFTDDSNYDVTVALTDLTDVNKALKTTDTPDEIIGIIGLDLLLLYDAVIDCKNLVMTIEYE